MNHCTGTTVFYVETTRSKSRIHKPRWRHQTETCSALLTLCVGNSPVTGEFPSQRPVTRNFDIFFDLRLDKWLSKQSWGWWFETPSRQLWRHRYAFWYNFSLIYCSYHRRSQTELVAKCINLIQRPRRYVWFITMHLVVYLWLPTTFCTITTTVLLQWL